MADLASGLGQSVDTFVIVMIIIIILLLIGFLIWFILFRAKFKNFITIRVKTKGATDLVTFDKYRYVKKRGVPEKIQLWKSKEYKPLPPDEAKDFTNKGKEYIEGWLVPTGEVSYIKSEINDIVYLIQDNKAKGEIDFKNTFDEKDKDFYSNQYFEDVERYNKTGFLEWISQNAGLIAILLLGILIVAFWNDIAKSSSSVSASNSQISQANARMIETLENLLKDRQYISYLNSTGKLGGYPVASGQPPD